MTHTPTFHDFSAHQVLQELHSTEQGLSDSEATSRKAQYGSNILREKKHAPLIILFFRQFTNLLIIILVIAAIISGILQEWLDAYAILAIILLNGIIGFIQEYKAERAIEALKQMTALKARVLRQGKEHAIHAKDLVPGDIIILEEGDRIPADGRLLESVALVTNEGALTGESMPVKKDASLVLEKNVPVNIQRNMVFMGTVIARGRGKGIVTQTGMSTEIGNIAGALIEKQEEITPLQKKLEVLGKQISLAGLVIVALVFILGLLRGFPPFEIFLLSVSLAVAAIPEGLPAVVTITLANGVQRMAKKNSIIRKLPAVETLGEATVVCTDKTGTLTKNEMTVRLLFLNEKFFKVTGEGYAIQGEILDQDNNSRVHLNEEKELTLFLHTGVLCNNSNLVMNEATSGVSVVGDPTEACLLVVAEKGGLKYDQIRNEYAFIREIPFSSERKMMTVIRKTGEKQRAYAKGAPEVILRKSSFLLENGKEILLTDERRQKILGANKNMTSSALRVLALAFHDITSDAIDDVKVEEDLVFIGLVGMMDPPRKEAQIAIKACHTAGIRVVMITGDNPHTAQAVGRELGVFATDKSTVLTGEDLNSISEDQFRETITEVAAYARVSPEHKLRIVNALKDKQEIVAMTGDGVNDAPAIERADIGIAMGLTGTEVTKEASDMIIADDNFASIEEAIEEGRMIYDNIIKSVKYLISCNIGELMAISVAIFAGLGSPLTPIQILWMNIVTDSPPALALAMEPADPDIMKRPPRNPQERILSVEIMTELLLMGVLVAIGTLGIFWWYLQGGMGGILKAGTVAFSVIILYQKFFALGISGPRDRSVIITGLFRNKWLWMAIAFGIISQVIITTWGPAQTIFKTVALSPVEWVIILLIASTAFFVPEAAKWIRIGKKKMKVSMI